jgi:uncharacterized protein (TIGR03066 family)
MRALGLAAAVLLVCGLSIRAEEKADNAKKLVGEWEVVRIEGDPLPVGSVIIFTKEGKMKVTIKKDGEERTFGATYKVDGDKLSVLLEGRTSPDSLLIKKVSADALVISDDKGRATMEFKRKK